MIGLIITTPLSFFSGIYQIALPVQGSIKLPNGAVGFASSASFRSPDAAWVRRDRWNQLTPDQQKKVLGNPQQVEGEGEEILPGFVCDLSVLWGSEAEET